jgi:hypothetical protein
VIRGARNKINLSVSSFKEFIDCTNLYVDKTKFIENVVNESNSVVLLTRPRRTGKSLNMSMLRVFFDCKGNATNLFDNLYIRDTEAFKEINCYPVIYLDFKNIRFSNFKKKFKSMIFDCAEYYLEKCEMNRALQSYLNDKDDYDTSATVSLCESLYTKYGVKPYILIDEYDKILIDNIHNEEYEKLRVWITEIFESCLKGNDYLKKAVLTGVARISKESLLSGLNNLVVYDIFTSSIYDTDFSLTVSEAKELMMDDELSTIKKWYNNIRVGNSKLYNIYSVMSYLHFGELDNYWGRSGTMDLLIHLMNKKKSDELANLISNMDDFVLLRLEERLSIDDLLKNDSGIYYYSLAVQSGYLTYDIESHEGTNKIYRVYVPNLELQSVWRDFIMSNIVRDSDGDLRNIFKNISNIELFNQDLQEFINYQLSYFDLDNELEKTYHVFVFGMVLALGYKCNSNLESGYGRYDLLIEANNFNAIIEFKRAGMESDLIQRAHDALKQIDDNKYYSKISNNLPVYKIGISCYKKKCFVKTIMS